MAPWNLNQPVFQRDRETPTKRRQRSYMVGGVNSSQRALSMLGEETFFVKLSQKDGRKRLRDSLLTAERWIMVHR
jgi:hypothetical protein